MALVIAAVREVASELPSREVVHIEERAASAMLAGDFKSAEVLFRRVLAHERRATAAWLGLSCVFWFTHRKDAGAMGLEIGVNYGRNINRSGACGPGFDFLDTFRTVHVGFDSVALIARAASLPPREQAAFEALLEVTDPNGSERDNSPPRALAAACAAFHADVVSLGVVYVERAKDFPDLSARDERLFLTCLGRSAPQWIQCGKGYVLSRCPFSSEVQSRFSVAQSLVYQ